MEFVEGFFFTVVGVSWVGSLPGGRIHIANLSRGDFPISKVERRRHVAGNLNVREWWSPSSVSPSLRQRCPAL